MKSNELRELSVDELKVKGDETRSELFNTQVKHTTGQLEDTARLRLLRRDIARIETAIREKQGASS